MTICIDCISPIPLCAWNFGWYSLSDSFSNSFSVSVSIPWSTQFSTPPHISLFWHIEHGDDFHAVRYNLSVVGVNMTVLVLQHRLANWTSLTAYDVSTQTIIIPYSLFQCYFEVFDIRNLLNRHWITLTCPMRYSDILCAWYQLARVVGNTLYLNGVTFNSLLASMLWIHSI